MRNIFHRSKTFIERYERRISSAALVTGFIVDSLTLRRVDLPAENILLASYIAIVAAGIAILNLYMAGKIRRRAFERAILWIPAVIQYALGGLFSGFVVFYSRSSSISAAWPFLALLAIMLVGNEMFRKYYVRLTFQVSVLFLALMSFLIFFLPIVAGSMAAWVFLLSGLASLLAITLFLLALRASAPKIVARSMRPIVLSVSSIYIAVNALYFANVIPPIPLSLQDAGIYHSVVPQEEGYELAGEAHDGCFLVCFRKTVRLLPGEPVYAYSAVFAPTRLSTSIAHRWRYYDEARGEWITASTIPFPIRGGRDGGYRGYSMKSNVFPGLWRVDVVTRRGQVIGRITFYVEQADARPPLEIKIDV